MKQKVNNLLVEKTFYFFILSLSFSLVLMQEDSVTGCLGRKQQSQDKPTLMALLLPHSLHRNSQCERSQGSQTQDEGFKPTQLSQLDQEPCSVFQHY